MCTSLLLLVLANHLKHVSYQWHVDLVYTLTLQTKWDGCMYFKHPCMIDCNFILEDILIYFIYNTDDFDLKSGNSIEVMKNMIHTVRNHGLTIRI